MSKKEIPDLQSVNFVAKETVITGEIQSNGDIRIDGILNGKLNSTGKVVVGATGKVEGEIICQNAEIEGELKAKLLVKERLSLKATSVFRGDIITSKLSIEPGAIFTGTCQMENLNNDRVSNIQQDSPKE
ncbi:MAG: polymer-forming cytoskeletal protein [Bacteroidales bacterium]|jgi:cytoskeletal protein CcmA (bactofilin family)|nr:polymer-forming cytoskeletal protein [Bacteroidales bacterium]